MVARESNGFHLILSTSEQKERSDEKKAIGPTHTDISALFESAAHAKRSGTVARSAPRAQFNLVHCLIGTKDVKG
jgi:hypothetical protein